VRARARSADSKSVLIELSRDGTNEQTRVYTRSWTAIYDLAPGAFSFDLTRFEGGRGENTHRIDALMGEAEHSDYAGKTCFLRFNAHYPQTIGIETGSAIDISSAL
jgi:hypothetical protein